MSPALEFRGVTKRFVAGTGTCLAYADVFRALDLEVLEGESVAIVGEAGTGKSTLLFCAAGLLTPDAGTVRWFGCADRTVAMQRVSYLSAASLVRSSPPRNAEHPRLYLVDAADRFDRAAVARVARWIARLRIRRDAIVIATRDAALGDRLAQRTVALGTRHAIPIVRPRAARVAEPPASMVSEGGSM